jgi:NADH:ubiquinone oxidoreductase subunit F (NADH-binding)
MGWLSRRRRRAARPAAASRLAHLDTPMDYESLKALGSIMGSGGLIVMDERSCMVDVAKFFMEFCMDESCGKCVPCRVGTVQMHRLLERITNGSATMQDLETLKELCVMVKETSSVWAWSVGAQPGVEHNSLLPERIRGAHPQPSLPGGRLHA